MAKLILKNCRIGENITDITIAGGIIENIGKTELEGIDVEGKSVYPGLFDIHCHGFAGFDTMDGANLSEMSEYLAERGITSWLPTTMTMDFNTIAKVVNSPLPPRGANVLGFHMEGPYISKRYKGAQNEKYIKNPDLDEFSQLKNIKIVTLAPELEGSMEFIKNCGCVVSLGHTECNYEQAMEAINNGASCLTHTFNAMPPLHHREPSLIGAALDKNIYVQVICDGLHIHPAVIRMLYRLFGKERMILISDSMRAAGLADGEYEFGGQKIIVKNKIARTLDGAIAGSTSNLMDCVKKAVEFGIPKDDAFFMASSSPSALMKVNKGHIKPGYDADLIVLDDKLNLVMTIINGKIVKHV